MQLAIFDSSGAVVASGSVSLPETSTTTYGAIKIDYETRSLAFRTAKNFDEVILSPPAGVALSACQEQATVEAFDDFTRTGRVLTPGLIPPGPQTMPIYLGPAGLTFEQTARLNVVCPRAAAVVRDNPLCRHERQSDRFADAGEPDAEPGNLRGSDRIAGRD